MTEQADTDGPVRPVAPVAHNDPSLPGLFRAASRQGRPFKLAAAVMVAIAIGVVALVAVAAPSEFALAFGRTEQVSAVVEDVGLSADQPRKRRFSGPACTVQVRWDENGVTRRGTGETREKEQPYHVGDEVEIAIRDGSDEVLFRTALDARFLLLMLSLIPAAFVGAAWYVWRGGRKWTRVARTVTAVKPVRVVVRGDRRPHRGRSSPIDLFERGYLVDVQWDESDDATRPILLVSGMRDLPGDGQELDVWPTGADHSPPYAIRRVDTGRWLLGSSV